jgi:phosphonopyruvate decarboxylase
MVNLTKLFNKLADLGVDFFTGVPDSLLNDFCLYALHNLDNKHHVMAANEGNAVAIASGHYFATGNIPLVYMQNSGIGNAMNPLLSLTHDDVYGVPMILVIGWRGDPAISDHAQHKKQGELTTVLMKDMDIPYEILDDENTAEDKFAWAVDKAKEISSPVALIVKKSVLTNKEKHQEYPESDLPNREEAISIVLDFFGKDAIYLATTGRATRELHEQLAVKGFGAGKEFLNVGSMGHISSVGIGIALARPEKKIVVFDGDAASIMHMGSFSTIGRYQPANIYHIVLNNGVNESVGGQNSAGRTTDLTKVASACGYETVRSHVSYSNEIQDALTSLESSKKPKFLDIHIKQGIRKDMPKLDVNHKSLKEDLMRNLIRK